MGGSFLSYSGGCLYIKDTHARARPWHVAGGLWTCGLDGHGPWPMGGGRRAKREATRWHCRRARIAQSRAPWQCPTHACIPRQCPTRAYTPQELPSVRVGIPQALPSAHASTPLLPRKHPAARAQAPPRQCPVRSSVPMHARIDTPVRGQAAPSTHADTPMQPPARAHKHLSARATSAWNFCLFRSFEVTQRVL